MESPSETLIALVPLLLFLLGVGPAMIGGLAMLSARLLRAKLGFGHAYLFGMLFAASMLVVRFVFWLADWTQFAFASIAVTVVLTLVLGSRFLSTRATDRAGTTVGARRAAFIAGLVIALLGAVGLAFVITASLTLRPID